MVPKTQHAPRLPVEIIEIILSYFKDNAKTPSHFINTADRGYLKHVSLNSLLKMRVLGREWNNTIMSFIFRELDLRWPFLVLNLLKKQNQAFVNPGMHGLRRLSIGHIYYVHCGQVFPGDRGAQFDLHPHRFPAPVLYTPDVGRILDLCIHNLTELKLAFVGPVGFSEEMVHAATAASNLKVLIITSTLARRHENGSESIIARRIQHDSETLIAFLNQVPSLESLSLNFLSLESLHVSPGSLPNLQHLFFADDESNTHAIVNFCRLYAKNLKLLEYSPSGDANEAASVVFALWDSIEALSIDAFPSCIPQTMAVYNFSRLRILRCSYSHISPIELEWLQSPFFQNIEIFITNYAKSKKNWEEILAGFRANPSIRPTNLKHIIFISSSPSSIHDSELVHAFQEQRLTCHFRGPMTYTEVLEAEVWVKNQNAQTLTLAE
ncbi:uncharacterized protein MELLADRAFT_84951 [Melampsora larici-populina 98AG31]|uniref:F-box domain-containing protein n=1 Tax=Melampsora larici-populina (strain 98AG31 / pathotype 3-4-7) TaxID=747676 RepID=F4RHI0_MELLP|nr:uncharacterized protein MELLADRAFT_84951 [Melampsora larici-populina 98AG31]EGG08356.1 hypothetical protein MELLADRAFT_84951 [Melampsora larici-populina 98AG31]